MNRLVFVYGSVLLLFFACRPPDDQKLTLAAAANVQFAVKEIAGLFGRQTGIESDVILGSSGKLTAQIKKGAPYNVFISADMAYPNVLFDEGYATDSPKVFAHGKLVMWSLVEGLTPSKEMLLSDKVRHIAIANPKTAPYGLAALEVLQHFGIYEQVKDKLVYGESVLQTNQFILSQSAAIGFTAKSVVVSPQMKDTGTWVTLGQDTYTPIAQGAVMIARDGRSTEAAEKFYTFLFSPKAKAILQAYGYATNAP